MSGLDDSVKVLSLGSVIGGRTLVNRGWSEAIRGLTRELAHHREGVSSDINVNVEFHVPGNLWRPDFEGVRTGTFKKSDSLIKIQVALPEEPPADPRALLLTFVWESLEAVDLWSGRRKLNVSTSNVRALVAEVESGTCER